MRRCWGSMGNIELWPLAVVTAHSRPSCCERPFRSKHFGTLTDRNWRLAIGWPNRATWWLVRQTHDECQSDIQPRYVLVVEMADLSSNSLPPNGDGLIGHNL